MVRAFTEFCFTPAVVKMQREQGSTGITGALLLDHTEAFDRITDVEAAFIAEREGFYQATVTETGWPYVQFRGGPKGFLRGVDDKTIAYADYSGNRQYLSAGNLMSNDRVAMILMDYPNQRRLKIWGRAKLVERKEAPGIIPEVHDETYRALPERAVIISVEAFDWNCPRHIPQRFTANDLKPVIDKYEAEISRLREEIERLKTERG